jgi:fumarate reductase flavoprotein subunit
MSMDWDMEIDILVIGAGGCGLAAALSANELGVEVGVVEKYEEFQGNTTLSTGSVPGGGTRFQREAKIDDSPEKFIEDLLRKSGPHEAEELTRLLAYESAPLVEWLVDYVRADLHLITDYLHVGHSVPRLHAPPARKGKYLHDDMLRAVRARNIPIAVGSPVETLVTDKDGAVTGAVVRGKRTGEQKIGAKKIFLATNGFAANPEMVRKYCPEIAEAEYFGGHGSTGEAILWGERLGGQFANIGAYQGYAVVSYPHGSLLSWTTIEKGGIVVDQKGRRFGDESIGYSGYAPDVLAHGVLGPGHPRLAYAIFDARIRDYVASHEEEFRELLELGGIKDRTSIVDLATTYGLDPQSLKETIQAYDAAARREIKDEFGRTDFGFAPLKPPYVICQVTPGLFHTQGGLKVNPLGMVLRGDHQVIKNLFAGGGATAGISGRMGARGYASGNGLLSALGLGRIAGRAAAKEVIEGV